MSRTMQFLSLSQMAERLNRSPQTLRKYIDEYEIPHIRMGNDFLFDEQEVIAHLKSRTAKKKEPVLKAAPKVGARIEGKGRFAGVLGI